MAIFRVALASVILVSAEEWSQNNASLEDSPCLCIFDIDRTLTGRQGDTAACPANSVQTGVLDTAYGGGTLTLSQLAQAVSNTFCNACYLGTISAGTASGDHSVERGVLHDRLATGA